MITFKQFINEARAAPLYHGTSIKSANGIATADRIVATRGEDWGKEENPYVSFTRSFTFAYNFNK